FAVILPDDVISGDVPCLAQMVEAYAQTGGCMVAAMEVAPEKASAYGVLDFAPTDGPLVRVRGMVEKPAPGTAPSNLAVIGRYILTPSVLETLNDAQTGAGGEVQLTDAIARETGPEGNVWGLRFKGERYDCGSKAGFLQATVAFALSRDDLRDELAEYLRALDLPAA
ncbi:MAG: UTP--glucose-1-phosphate uridylyltransferase, partial [Gemmobacter sp.]